MTERRLAAILSIDVAGYSRLMGRDETGTLAALKAYRLELIDPMAVQYGGKTIKLMGDGALMEFASAVDAVRFAVSVQLAMRARNAKIQDDRRIDFRIGINVGDVIAEGDDIYGDGVNVAARLEGLAEPGGICLHRSVRDQVRDKLVLDVDDLGEVEVKNIERPVRAFHVILNDKAAALAAEPVDTPAKPARKRALRLFQGAVGIALALLLIAGLAWWQPWGPEFEPVDPDSMTHPLPAKPSIAVMALDDLSSGADKDYLSDAIAEGIITELSRFPELFVISRNSSFHYRDKPVDVREVARDLGVRYILEGSQQKSGNQLRVTVQLIDAIRGNHVWAETYDRDLAELFVVQDEISTTVASTLGEKLTRIAGNEAKRADPARLRAFEHWMAGVRHFREFTREGSEKARQAYLRAIEADPGLARGHASLAWVHINGYRWGWTDLDRDEALAQARKEASKAMALEPDDYHAHFTMAAVLMQAGEHEKSIAEFEKALELNHNSGLVMSNLAELLIYTGRASEAIELMYTAMRLDPHHPDWYYWNLGWAQYFAGDCDGTLATMRKMSRLPPLANRTLATALVCLGRLDEARAAIDTLLEHDPEYSLAKARLNLKGKFKDPAVSGAWIDDLRKAGLPEEPPLPLPDKPSIAVLAFDNLSGDPAQEFLSDAMSDSIITELSRFPEMFVIARNSSFKYKSQATDVRDIGRELGVRYVIEGGMQRAGDRLRVNAQLIEADSGKHIWAESYDRQNEDVFAVQDAIVEAIVTVLAIKVEGAERSRAVSKATSSLEAYDLFLRARDLQLRKGFWVKEVNQEARNLLEQAVALDPRFSRAYADLAWTYLFDFLFGWAQPPEPARDRAQMLAQKAVELDQSSARAHFALGYVYLFRKEHDLAMAEIERAIALNPNDAGMRDAAATLNIYGGNPGTAIEQITEAMRLNPYHPDRYWHLLGWASFHAGKYEEGLEAMKRIVNPGAADHRVMAALNARLGRPVEAANHTREVLIHEPDFAISHFRRNLPYRNESDAQDYAEALALAGLPE
jgi:TolB-like protein/class 3 adenylate cyclase/Flp pilus assembly protein TadD